MENKELLIMSDALEEELISFISNHPAKRLSRNLRDLLVHYMCNNVKLGLPEQMEDTLFDLMGLFALLDKLEGKRHWLRLNTNWIIDPDERAIIQRYREIMLTQLKFKNDAKKN
jgi:hypothetical protein